MKITILLAVTLFLASCTSTRSVMDSWVGNTKQSLILKWGPPERTASDGGDGQILVYSREVYNPYSRQTIYQCKMFYIGSDDKVYHWIARSSLVPPQQINLSLY